MDKCPFCGAEIINDDDYMVFLCGTGGFSDDLYRTSECYDRQIANLKERLEAWREWQNILIDCDTQSNSNEFKKLVKLGEI